MKNSVRTRAVLAAVAAIAAGSLAACGSSSTAGGDAGTTSSTGASNAATTDSGVTHAKAQLAKYAAAQDHYGAVPSVANVPDLHGKTVWYVPIGTSVPVLATMGTAITQALGHLGASVHTCDGKFTPTTVASCMSTAATQGADAVVTGFVDYSMAPSAFQSLASKGIPTLVAGQSAPSGVTASKSLGFFDPTGLTKQAYALMADAAIADSNGSAKVLQVELDDSATTKGNTQATSDEFSKYCSGCSVTTVSATTASMSSLGSLISAKLAANPDTDYLILPQDAFLQAAMPGLQSAGFANKVKVIAAGGSTVGLQAVKAGQISYDIGQGAMEQGWAIADAAVRLLAGAEVLPETEGPVRVFTPANVGGLDLTDANYSTSAWYGSDAWQQDFLKAWGAQS